MIAAALTFMVLEVGPSAVAGVVLMLALVPVQAVLARKIGGASLALCLAKTRMNAMHWSDHRPPVSHASVTS